MVPGARRGRGRAIGAEPPTAGELPPPSAGLTGWPWEPAPVELPERTPGGSPWPRFTVVTPSYNQAEFLEATLRSVILQGYPNLEYIVMDGGSDDGSVDIIRKYEPWIDHWESRPDRGQSDAINRGFQRASGDILAWLNSDDVYYPGALAAGVRALEAAGADIFLGAMDKVERAGAAIGPRIKRSTPHQGERMHRLGVLRERPHAGAFHFYQPSMFWRREIWEATGGLDERYHYVMDLEWCSRALAAGAEVVTTDLPITAFAVHPAAKSEEHKHRQHLEQAKMYLRLARRPEFRTIPCLASAVKPLRVSAALHREVMARRGHPLRALGLRVSAHLLKGVERLIPEVSRKARPEDFEGRRLAADALRGAGPGDPGASSPEG